MDCSMLFPQVFWMFFRLKLLKNNKIAYQMKASLIFKEIAISCNSDLVERGM